jgi:hypothetical protein
MARSAIRRSSINNYPGSEAWSNRGEVLMKASVIALVFLAVSTTFAVAIDLSDLAPCRPAAARFCDRSGGMTWSNLARCGATLAAHSFRVGNGCRDLLRRYGQL